MRDGTSVSSGARSTHPTSSSSRTDPSSDQYTLFECPECSDVVLAFGDDEPTMSCHGEPMQRVAAPEIDIESPDIRQVLLDAFGLPKAGLNICLSVVGEGPLSANEVAEKLGYDRSTVTRYLNELVDLGLLHKSQLNREDGGVVNVYHSTDLERMRRETLLGFLTWAGEAAALIDAANRTKQEYREANPNRELPALFWESFGEN
jgi:predicted transcriptional regulator